MIYYTCAFDNGEIKWNIFSIDFIIWQILRRLKEKLRVQLNMATEQEDDFDLAYSGCVYARHVTFLFVLFVFIWVYHPSHAN